MSESDPVVLCAPYELSLSVVRGDEAIYHIGEPILIKSPPILHMHDGSTIPCAAIIDAESCIVVLVPDIAGRDEKWCTENGHEWRLPEIIKTILENAGD